MHINSWIGREFWRSINSTLRTANTMRMRGVAQSIKILAGSHSKRLYRFLEPYILFLTEPRSAGIHEPDCPPAVGLRLLA